MTHYSRKFSDVYDAIMYLPENLFLRTRRKRLLSELSGNILEVGTGTGINFKYYNRKIRLTGVEPSPFMFAKAKKKKITLPGSNRFTLYNIGCGFPEMERLITPNSIDAIVCTLVLCTIPDPEKAIENFMKWLKPGGQLLIIEHVRAHNRVGQKIQHLFTPVWKRIADGCHLDRPTDILLTRSTFTLERECHFWLGLPFYEAVFEKSK